VTEKQPIAWKAGIYASLAWLVISIGFGVLMVWYISSHPAGPAVDEVRETKAGEAAGQLVVVGWLVIWGYLFIKHRVAQQTSS